MNRRAFIKGLGAFMILPGAGRIWKATRPVQKLQSFWWQTNCEERYMSKEYLAAFSESQGGIHHLLQQCRDVIEPMEPLDIRKMFDEFYRIRLERAKSQNLDIIECITDLQGAELIRIQHLLNS